MFVLLDTEVFHYQLAIFLYFSLKSANFYISDNWPMHVYIKPWQLEIVFVNHYAHNQMLASKDNIR